MSKTYMIRFEENDLGQIVDGLAREDSWRKTADYFRSGYSPDDSFAIEERNDEHEAASISTKQTDEMRRQSLKLVVPASLHATYTAAQRAGMARVATTALRLNPGPNGHLR